MSTKKKVLIVLFLLGVSLYSFSASGAGATVTPSGFRIDYDPGTYKEFVVYVSSIEDPLVEFDWWVPDDIEVISIDSDENDVHRITFGFTIPENLPPGEYSSLVLFSDKPEEREYGRRGSGIQAKARVGVPVRFFIPYPEKFIGFRHMQWGDFNWQKKLAKGDTVFFEAILENRGEQVVNEIMGIALFYKFPYEEGDQTYEVRFTKDVHIQTGEEIILGGEWNLPEDSPLGKYAFNASFVYDGITINAPQEYLIQYGDRLLGIVGLSPTETKIGGIVPFEVTVESLWGESISFSASLTVYDLYDNVLGHSTSATTEAAPYGTSKATTFLDTSNWQEGIQTVGVTLNFDDQQTSEEFTVRGVTELAKSVESKEESPRGIATTVIVVFILLLLIVIAALLRKYLKQRGEDDEDF